MDYGHKFSNFIITVCVKNKCKIKEIEKLNVVSYESGVEIFS